MSEKVKNLQSQLDAINAFMASPAYSSYQATFTEDVAVCEQTILSMPPTDIPSLFSLLNLYGRRDVLRENSNFFEAARDGLKKSIDDAVNDEIENANTKQ